MSRKGEDLYTSDEYLQKNPDYHLKDSGWKARLILDMIKKNGLAPSTIIDIGCGAGGVIKTLAHSMSPNVSFKGFDISPLAIDLARDNAPSNTTFTTGDYFAEETSDADLILIIDVIEHLDDYYTFLRQLRQKKTKCIFHIPLDLSSRSVLRPHIMKQQRDSVGHVHYFTRAIVWWILEDSGFNIRDWHFTKPFTDISPSPTYFRGSKKALRNLSFSINKDLSAKLWGNYSLLILVE